MQYQAVQIQESAAIPVPGKALFGGRFAQVIVGVGNLALPESCFRSNASTETKAIQSLMEGGKPVDAESQSSWNLSSGWISAYDLEWLQLDLIAAPPDYITRLRSGL